LTILAICLTTICLVSLISMICLIWWTMDSAGRHSISAAKAQARAAETMLQGQRLLADTAKAQANLTETLLLGRPMPAIEPAPPSANGSGISWTPNDLSSLPDTVKENLIREHEEAGSWPNPSEMLLNPLLEEEPGLG
jgi:type II secretory pathway pseudopilin PulG